MALDLHPISGMQLALGLQDEAIHRIYTGVTQARRDLQLAGAFLHPLQLGSGSGERVDGTELR